MKFLLSMALVFGLATTALAHGHGGGYPGGGYRAPVYGGYRGGVRIGIGVGGYGPYYGNPYYPYGYAPYSVYPPYPYGYVRPGVGIYIR